MVTENNYRILVIDDNTFIHQDFRKILTSDTKRPEELEKMNLALFGKRKDKEKLPEFQIDSAFQSDEGIAFVRKSLTNRKPYAVAFVDVMMPPGNDGIETIKAIWKEDPDLQIVICTAYAKYSWEDIRSFFGDTDRLFILKKPFDNIEVVQLACSLSKKWNLNYSMKEQFLELKKQALKPSTKVDSSISRMNETLDALEAINKSLQKNLSEKKKP